MVVMETEKPTATMARGQRCRHHRLWDSKQILVPQWRWGARAPGSLAGCYVCRARSTGCPDTRQTEQQRTHHGASWAPERSRIGAEWVGWRPSPDPLPTPHHPRLQNQGRVVTLIRAILVGADDGSWRAGLGWGQSGGSWLLCARHVVTHMCPRPAPVWGDPRREPRAASDSGLTPGICGDPTGAPQGRPSLWCWVQSGTGGAAGL